MSRIKRILVDNFSYHVVARGSQRQNVFIEEEDFRKYIVLLQKYKAKFPTKTYAYCLMSNHVHLLLDPVCSKHLNKFMHGLNLSYAMYFNYKYTKCGHLWQNRYKSYLIQKDQYLFNAITYIEHNPIRANMCARNEEYKWCSYKSRVFGENNKLLDVYEV